MLWAAGMWGHWCPLGFEHRAGTLQRAQHCPPPVQGPPGQPGYPGATGPPGLPVSTAGARQPLPPPVSPCTPRCLLRAPPCSWGRGPVGNEHHFPAGLIPVPSVPSHTFLFPLCSPHLFPVHPMFAPMFPQSMPHISAHPLSCMEPSSPSFPRASKASEATWAPLGRKGSW